MTEQKKPPYGIIAILFTGAFVAIFNQTLLNIYEKRNDGRDQFFFFRIYIYCSSSVVSNTLHQKTTKAAH